jgi:hypothetical protein
VCATIDRVPSAAGTARAGGASPATAFAARGASRTVWIGTVRIGTV